MVFCLYFSLKRSYFCAMKKNIFPFFLTLVILLACQPNSDVHSEWIAIDSLCVANPEQAISQLEQMALKVNSKDEWAWHRWQLLRIKAQDKADRPLTTDSIIKTVVSYFDKSGSADERIEAYYYLGRTYHELYDTPRAVTAYLTAIELSEKNGIPDERLFTNCTSQLSGLFIRLGNPRAAIDIALKGYRVAKTRNILDPILIMDVGSGYKWLYMKDSTEYYFDEALKDICKTHSEYEYVGCLCEICSYYAYYRNHEKASLYMQIINTVPVEYWERNFTTNKATYFEAFGPMDSAIYYNTLELKNTANLDQINSAARSLMEIYRVLGNYEQSSYYAHMYSETNESILVT